MENHVEKLQAQLELARQSLHQTVADIEQKVELVGIQLEPEHLVCRHMALAACIAAALGFMAGDREGRATVATLVIGGALGAALTLSKTTDNDLPIESGVVT